MAAPRLSPDHDRPSPPPTHYEVLGLSPSMLDSSARDDPSPLIKRTYHRALLRNHPDKTKTTSSSKTVYSIDQISRAFAVLSAPPQRAAYDASLRRAHAARPAATRFHTGIDSVDLDDLAFDAAEARWLRPCRCGNPRGYSFDEADLMDAADDGLLLVGCQDCSLWLSVHFAVVEDESKPDRQTASSND